MTIKIIIVLAAGILSGYFILPEVIYDYTGLFMDIGLCCLLFFVGIDIGNNKKAFTDLKKTGLRILVIPAAIIFGSLFGGFIASTILGMRLNEGMAVASGLSWYTLSAIILTPYSAELGTLAFLSNVFREIITIISIPLIAKHIGYLETIGAGAAISMDTGLPVITKNTNSEVVVVSFISGVILSLSVTVLVPIFIGM